MRKGQGKRNRTFRELQDTIKYQKWLCISTGHRRGHFCSNQPEQLGTGQWLSMWLPILFANLTVLITWNRKTTPSGGSPHKKTWKKETLCLFVLALSGELIYPAAEVLQDLNLLLQGSNRLMTGSSPGPSRTPVSARDCWVTQPCGMNN